MNSPQGWLNIYKPKGLSSFAVVKKIRHCFDLKKIGHGGTLDPLAEGILPIAIGKATKLIPFINSNLKEYEFELKWGFQTSTDDAEGEILSESNYIPSENEIKDTLNFFVNKEILQKPPKASAIKIGGHRAYKLLREKKDFDTKAKKVFIYSSKIIDFSNPIITKIKIECGKGFYVRSFARDLAEKLGTKGHVGLLKRTKVGCFSLENANLLDDLLKIRQTLFRFKGFHKSISMLDDILAYELDNEEDKVNISQGKSIKVDVTKLSKPTLNSTARGIVFLTVNGDIFSFGKLIGDLFKPDKVLI